MHCSSGDQVDERWEGVAIMAPKVVSFTGVNHAYGYHNSDCGSSQLFNHTAQL